MSKYKIEIFVETEADPSCLLEKALCFGDFFEEYTSEECTVDEDKTSVSEDESK